jgi:hypothetical protein
MTEEIDVEPWLAIRRDVHRHKRDQSTMGWKQLAAGNTVFTMRARLEEVIHGHPSEPRQEAFAQALARGGSSAAAAFEGGYRPG